MSHNKIFQVEINSTFKATKLQIDKIFMQKCESKQTTKSDKATKLHEFEISITQPCNGSYFNYLLFLFQIILAYENCVCDLHKYTMLFSCAQCRSNMHR